MIGFFYNLTCRFYLFIAGLSTRTKKIDFDYSFYLSEGYKKNDPKITSTVVCNHVSWLDPVVLIKNVGCAFSPSAEFKGLPLLGTLIDALDSIYIPRGGSDENKAKALECIRDRQELIEETGIYSPFLIFAEAGTSNGTSLIKFKKGAFFAEKTVRPIFMKYNSNLISPAFDVMEFLPLCIF